jgi:hypothetical protein
MSDPLARSSTGAPGPLRSVWRFLVAGALIVTGMLAAMLVALLGLLVALCVGLMRVLPKKAPKVSSEETVLDARQTPQGWVIDAGGSR